MISRKLLVSVLVGYILIQPLAYAQPALEILSNNRCLGCHDIEKKRVGPSFIAIAQHYQTTHIPDPKQVLISHIQSGGQGRWGRVPMPPQAHISTKDAELVATWLLTLDLRN